MSGFDEGMARHLAGASSSHITPLSMAAGLAAIETGRRYDHLLVLAPFQEQLQRTSDYADLLEALTTAEFEVACQLFRERWAGTPEELVAAARHLAPE